MKTYLLKRIFVIFVIALVMAIVHIIVSLKYDFSEPMPTLTSAFYMLLFVPIIFFKPNWFLVLPFSRKKLFFLNLFETVMMYLILIGLFYVVHLYFVFVKDYTGDSSIKFYIYMGFFLGCLRLAIPINLSNLQQRRMSDLSKVSPVRAAQSILYVILGLFAFRLLGKEPYFLYCIAVSVIISVPCTGLSVLQMPKVTFNKFRKITIFTCVIVCFGSLLTALGVTSFSQNWNHTNISMALLGHIPLPLSTERTKQIFSYEKIKSEPVLITALDQIKDQISFAEWVDRTKKCKKLRCFELSDTYLPLGLSVDQRLEAFYILMSSCSLKLNEYERVRCSGPRLDSVRLEPWLEFLSKVEITDRWLYDSDPLKQAVAIRALTKKVLDEKQTQRITELANSDDEAVKNIADFKLTYYSTIKNKNGKSCTKCRLEFLSDLF